MKIKDYKVARLINHIMFILVSIALMGYLKTDVTAQQESSSFMLNNLQNNEFKLYTFNGVDVSNEYNDEFMELFATNDDDRIKDFIAENKLLIVKSIILCKIPMSQYRSII